MQKFRETLREILLYIGAFSMVLVSLLLFMQTVGRYIFNISFVWADELARYSIIWGALLCAAVGVGDKSHTALDFIYQKFPEKVKEIISIILNLLYCVFSVAIANATRANIKLGMKSVSPGLGIHVAYVYLALTVSMLLILVFLIMNITEDIKRIAGEKGGAQ